MKLSTLLLILGIKHTPKYAYSFAANDGLCRHDMVTFADGRRGYIRYNVDGTYSPDTLIKRDKKMVFVTFDAAAAALYRGLVEYTKTKKK